MSRCEFVSREVFAIEFHIVDQFAASCYEPTQQAPGQPKKNPGGRGSHDSRRASASKRWGKA